MGLAVSSTLKIDALTVTKRTRRTAPIRAQGHLVGRGPAQNTLKTGDWYGEEHRHSAALGANGSSVVRSKGYVPEEPVQPSRLIGTTAHRVFDVCGEAWTDTP
jgi:hypothetical protein